MAKTEKPSESFAYILKMARLCCSLVGVDCANPNYRINWMTRMVFFCIVVFFILTANTIANALKDDWKYALEAASLVGSVMQGVAKFLTGILLTKDFVAIRFQLERLYADYQERGEAYCEALTKSCSRLWRVVKVVIVIYFCTFVSVIIMPFIMLAVTGKRILLMHFLIPFLDISTDFGYFATLAFHLLCVLNGAFGLFAGDLLFLLYLTQAFVFVDILKIKIQELNECLRLGVGNSLELLEDIIQWHQFYTEYNEHCNQLFYYIITCQITTAGVSIVCTLFMLLFSDWPGVYSYLVLSFSGLYVYCILGTRIETCNDEFCVEIYNINWYSLPIAQRKMICLMLVKAQCPSNIMVGGVLPLSVNTGLKITKTIYSMFTMMVRFMADD